MALKDKSTVPSLLGASSAVSPAQGMGNIPPAQQVPSVFSGNGIVGKFEPEGVPRVFPQQSIAPPPATMPSYQPVPSDFNYDANSRDGGFFGWLGGLVKNRKKLPGESDEDYDYRMTRNNARIATLANAIRHMGNIYFTSKGAPSQQFNDPTASYWQSYQTRKSERAAQAAREAERAYRAANLGIKQQSLDNDKAYKDMIAKYKDSADKRADAAQKYNQEMKDKEFKRNTDNDEWNHKFKTKQLAETTRYHDASLSQGERRIAIAAARAGGKGSSSNNGRGFATPTGRLSRKYALNNIERKQLMDWLIKNGHITGNMLNSYKGTASDPQGRKALEEYIIGWAAGHPGKSRDKFRKYLQTNFGYAPTNTVPYPSRSQRKPSVVKGKYNIKKNSAKGNIRSKFHVQ